jgi:hypothetical protein
MSDTTENAERTIRHTFRLRESVMLRLAKLKVSDTGGSWSDVLERALDVLEGRQSGHGAAQDAGDWPEGRVLTRDQQRDLEAIAFNEDVLLRASPDAVLRFRQIQRMSFGPRRARALELLQEEVHDPNSPYSLAGEMERRANLRILEEQIRGKAAGDYGIDQWTSLAGRSPKEIARQRRELARALLPEDRPFTYRVGLEAVGAVPAAALEAGETVALPQPEPTSAPDRVRESPDEIRERIRKSEEARAEEDRALKTEWRAHVDATATSEERARPSWVEWYRRTFGADP